jgi:L-serine dehydratase
VLRAFDARGNIHLQQTYYSIGGGFVLTEREMAAARAAGATGDGADRAFLFPFRSAAEMLAMGRRSGKTIAEMKHANELVLLDASSLDARLEAIGQAMSDCLDRGLRMEGILPGGLKIRRRARAIHQQLLAERGQNLSQPHVVNDYLAVYAMAVNEENAVGGRVVTSPTNGAAGVVPAVLRYYREHCVGATPLGIPAFLLTAAAIGGLIKFNASISGAEVGCQGEVGSASAMAAAGLCAALGGTNEQVENAAEIVLEHHLGMTCDPVVGLVQMPCIERNGLGRDQGGLRGLAGAARNRRALHAARHLHRGDAADRARHVQQVQGDLPRRPRRQSTELLTRNRRGEPTKFSTSVSRQRLKLFK